MKWVHETLTDRFSAPQACTPPNDSALAQLMTDEVLGMEAGDARDLKVLEVLEMLGMEAGDEELELESLAIQVQVRADRCGGAEAMQDQGPFEQVLQADYSVILLLPHTPKGSGAIKSTKQSIHPLACTLTWRYISSPERAWGPRGGAGSLLRAALKVLARLRVQAEGERMVRDCIENGTPAEVRAPPHASAPPSLACTSIGNGAGGGGALPN